MSAMRTVQSHLHFTPSAPLPKAGPLWAAPAPACGSSMAAAQPSVLSPKVRLPGGDSCQPAQAAPAAEKPGPHSLQTLGPQQLPGGSQTWEGGGREGRGGELGGELGAGSRPAAGLPGARAHAWDFGPWFAASAVLFWASCSSVRELSRRGNPERRGLGWWPLGALPQPHGLPSSAR